MSFNVFLSKILAIQSQNPLKCTGYPKVHTFFRIYGVHFKESLLYLHETSDLFRFFNF